MTYIDAIEIILGKKINPYNDVILQEDNGQLQIIQWNITEPQPSQEEINILLSKCKNDININCVCNDINKASCKYKEQKINQLRNQCKQTIYKGFYSSAWHNENHYYTFDEEDQSNFTGLLSLINSGSTSQIMLKSQNMEYCEQWTHEEFIQLCEDAKTHKEYYMTQFYIKKAGILAANNKNQVDNISWEW